jgi:hypothetical protein
MRLLDLYYRAFRSFRSHTTEENTSQKLRKIISHANYQHDHLVSIKYECHIDSDWIENIEAGLVFVEKAIREDRQFIRTEGEVVPIEKVKRTSKQSIEHLSRHSDYITRAPIENEDLIPDKLYIVEKLNDYLVYENRFIYMLLCYLKDFIQMRLDKIRDKTTSYESHMKMDKAFDANQRHVTYQLKYDDLYKNDPFLMDQFKKIPLVDRIETIYAIAVSLLGTPLMKEVSKAPMIKPPVVKTNVLRMNQNFRASLKLYDYITSYSKDGYVFNEVKKTFNPFPFEMSDEVADIIQLNSVIAYIVGNDLQKELETRFKKDEVDFRKEENKKHLDEIRRLKKKIEEMNEDPYEYMVKLEKRNIQLEKDSDELILEKEKNEALSQVILKMNQEKLALDVKISELIDESHAKDEALDHMKQKYVDDLIEQENVHQAEIESLILEHEQTIEHMIQTHESELLELKERHQLEIQALDDSHKAEIESIIYAHDMMIQELNQQLDELKSEIDRLNSKIETERVNHQQQLEIYQQEILSLEQKIQKLDEAKKFANAQYLAIKKQKGLVTEADDFTSRERFKELEQEMIAYKKLFKEQWKKTKVKIREQIKQDMMVTNKPEEKEEAKTP